MRVVERRRGEDCPPPARVSLLGSRVIVNKAKDREREGERERGEKRR